MSALQAQLRMARDALFPRACIKKLRYLTEDEAKGVAKVRGRAINKPLRVYNCADCQGWHVTKMEKYP